MAVGEQIERQWNLLKTLQTRGEGIPLQQLAGDFGVSERTIQRDLEFLRDLGFPILFETDEFGKRFWRMPPSFFKTGGINLSMTEAVSLHLARELSAPLTGTPFAEGFDSVLEKIRSMIPQKARDYFAGLSGLITVRPFAATDYSRHAQELRILNQAIRENLTVQVAYRSLWRQEEYQTLYDPYGLVLHLDDLFLVGHSHRAGALRVFKVSRILGVELTRQTFVRPEDFDLEHLFRNSFGIVQREGRPLQISVRFTGPAAGMVEERIWHDSQRLEWIASEGTLFEPAGDDHEALIATFELCDTVEFKRWLKGFGEQAVVISPTWLREEIRHELLATAERYAT